MIKKFIPLLLIMSFKMGAQIKKPIEELINTEEPGWELVKEWIDEAKNKVEVLPVNSEKAKQALYDIQVTTRSPMGAIVYNSGGILIDNGWIRILGSGSEKLDRSLPEWNTGKAFDDFGKSHGFLLVADDAIGGFFILNGGGLGTDVGKIYYLSPDNLEYEPLGMTYTEFLLFCFNNDLDKFYERLRWKDWKTDVINLDGNKTFSFFPYLWTKEGKDINKNSRKAVPIEEHYLLTLDLRKQLGLD